MLPLHIVESIKKARLKARLSQEGLAALASVSRRTVLMLESNQGDIKLGTLTKILDALGLTLTIVTKRETDD